MQQDKPVSVKVSSAPEMNVSMSNIAVLPSSEEMGMPLKPISLQTMAIAGSRHQSISHHLSFQS